MTILLITRPPPPDADTTTVWPLDAVPVAPFCTVNVKLPAFVRLALPANCVDVFVVSEKFATVHGAHPVPVMFTSALLGSKPVPVMVNVNACPAIGGFGLVVIEVICGPVPPEAPETVIDSALEAVPADPFCTVTLKLPPPRVAVPSNMAVPLLKSALLEIVHGEQPGPLKVTRAVEGSKPVPVIENVKDCPEAG